MIKNRRKKSLSEGDLKDMSRGQNSKMSLNSFIVRGEWGDEYIELEKLRQLLLKTSLKSDQLACELIKKAGLAACLQWENIHSNPHLKYVFSESSPELVNDFARLVLVYLNKESKVLELGCGFGNDTLFLAKKSKAHFTSIDCSPTAIVAAQKQADQERARINYIRGDYVEKLAQLEGEKFDMIYSHFGANFWPVVFFDQFLLPAIAKLMNQKSVFCLAMQTAQSDSVNLSEQQHFQTVNFKGHDYLYTIHQKSRLFSMYPKNKESILSLLHQYFEIAYEEQVELEGYQTPGQVEVFTCVIARLKDRA